MSTPDHRTDALRAEPSLDPEDASQKTAKLQRLGLLGHLFKLAMASGVSAVVDHATVPLSEGTLVAAQAGHAPGGSRRNLQWVLPHTDAGAVGEDDLLLLADAQTSGALLMAGELPRAPVIGELVPRRDTALIIL